MAGRNARFAGLFAAAALLVAVDTEGAETAPSSQQQVTVEGHREKLERRVEHFVAAITPAGPDTSLQRWTEPVCPLVAGMSAQQGEGVLTRVSEIAAKAGAKLAPEHCQPNLLVIVTPDPPALIQAWRAQTRGRIFNRATPTSVRHFIEESRPVRAWYNTGLTSEEGEPLSSGAFHAPSPDPTQTMPMNTWVDDTRLSTTALTNLASVILIVDSRSLQHLKVGQLADYVGMVGLGRLDTNAHTADAPTILNLFASTDADGGVPEGLTDWDEAYLYALYHTRQSSRTPRSAITRSVTNELEKAGE